MSSSKFDEYASTYSAVHHTNLAASGEPPEYFAEYKLACLKRFGATPEARILDYGCGIGNVTSVLAGYFGEVHGYDPSPESLRFARERLPAVTFHAEEHTLPDAHFDAAVLSGVLHHVPRAERAALLSTLLRKLRPGGRLFVFEHNPLNPVTRHVVATCPFDDDADLLWPWQLRKLVARAGYANLRRDFIVFFPNALSFLRPLEPSLRWLPLGAQTLLVAERG